MSHELYICRAAPENSAGLADMAKEFKAAGESNYELAIEDLARFFEQVELYERAENLPPDRVRQSQFWLCRGNRLLGGSRLRHTLIPILELDGGHIGYDIRPSERGQGYGSELLRLTLHQARALGLSRVLLTTEPLNLVYGQINYFMLNVQEQSFRLVRNQKKHEKTYWTVH